jgi:hypothetical protein
MEDKDKMNEKVVMAVRLTPETRDKLSKLRREKGMSFGVLIDLIVKEYVSNE